MVDMTTFDAADYLTSPLLSAAGFRHAFFTRRGGVSEGAYHSLNFSVAVGDDEANVAENLRRGAEALGVAPERLHFLSQVHGSAVHTLDPGDDRHRTLTLEGDALTARTGRLACGVRSADCLPILLAERSSGAVAAIHAGWRGLVRGVVEAGVRALRDLVANEGEIIAAIGPHISAEAFEVSADVAGELVRVSPDPEVLLTPGDGAKIRVNLRRIARSKLEHSGLARHQIDDVWGCTVGDAERFFSYRRDGKKSGRHLSAIVPGL